MVKKNKEKEPQAKRTQARNLWIQGEELLLAESFIQISEDPKTGSDQNNDTFWYKILDVFNEETKKNNYPSRTKNMLTGKWTLMNRYVQKFNSLVQETLVMSGENDEDWMTMVEILFKTHTGSEFKHKSAWLFLKDKHKWKNLESTLARRNRLRVTNKEPEHFGEDVLPWPPGAHRIAKSQRSSNSTASSGSNPVMFQEMMKQQYELDRKAKIEIWELMKDLQCLKEGIICQGKVDSEAKKAAKSHDPLALLGHSNASSSQSHANSSYSPQLYYVTHPSLVVDYEDEYQGELQGDSQEDKLTTTMMLLARAITQKFSTPTNNRLRTSSNTRIKHVFHELSQIRERQMFSVITAMKKATIRDCQKPRVRDAKYFREQMLLAMKDEAGSNLNNEENDFMLDTSYGEEIMEELPAAVMLMA
ncbi:hypothetical protein Tco_1071044 [Tanacetum coccineum]|uniref:Myb/SANT-like domain-containing protein n=1 Tax=Tanacetum coccineum TaxID=301880 RepID=A0ABQ5HN64_9ASTR